MQDPSSTTTRSESPNPRRRRLRAWGLRAALVVLALCVVSPTVDYLLSPRSAWGNVTAVVDDPRFGSLGDPRVPEHDPFGFRNPAVPDTCDVVAIGDSNTYGTLVGWRDAWPKQLERLSGRSVYNMSVSGWGPVNYREMLQSALTPQPKLVIIGLYLGNDLFDAYRDCYLRPLGPTLRDPARQEEYAALEAKAPSLARIHELYSM